jgi:hypothetical protein
MKIFTSIYSNKITRIAVALLLTTSALVFSSCSKNEMETPSISGLMVVNASPSYGTYNVYINNAVSPANTKGALPFLGTISPYFNITPGANILKFTTASNTESVYTETTNLDQDKAYSYFLINDLPSLSGLLVQDDLSLTSAEKAFVRFINLSPDAGSLDLVVSGGAVLVADKAFKSASEFISADGKPYTLELKDKVSGAVVATKKDVTLTAGKMYTVVAAGMSKPGELQQALRIEVITNR